MALLIVTFALFAALRGHEMNRHAIVPALGQAPFSDAELRTKLIGSPEANFDARPTVIPDLMASLERNADGNALVETNFGSENLYLGPSVNVYARSTILDPRVLQS